VSDSGPTLGRIGDEECHEDMGTGPCGKSAVGYREDPTNGGRYPVCHEHVRPPMVSRRAKPDNITITCHLGSHSICPGKAKAGCQCPCHTRKKKGER
jgi:hypothetical protein